MDLIDKQLCDYVLLWAWLLACSKSIFEKQFCVNFLKIVKLKIQIRAVNKGLVLQQK